MSGFAIPVKLLVTGRTKLDLIAAAIVVTTFVGLGLTVCLSPSEAVIVHHTTGGYRSYHRKIQ
jgi:hypothetical protein